MLVDSLEISEAITVMLSTAKCVLRYQRDN